MILALSIALADDTRPAPPPPAPGDCATVEVLRPGPTTRTCASISVPPSAYADLLSAEAWGEHVADLRRLDAAACMDDLDRIGERAAWWKAQAERPAPAIPPAAWLGVGVLGGVALSLGTAWAWGEVAGS